MRESRIAGSGASPGSKATIGVSVGASLRRLLLFGTALLPALLGAPGSGSPGAHAVAPPSSGGGALVARGGGACVPIECLSADPTNSPGCYKHLGDAELLLYLGGTPSQPFDPPAVCGEPVLTPAEARTILGTSGPSPCDRFKRAALAATFNIRRSILVGDGLLGEDGVACFTPGGFRIVLRCGDVFVPDDGTEDPSDALCVTEATPLERLVEAASELCALVPCPPRNTSPCGKTIGRLAAILDAVNSSRSGQGDCGLCKGDREPPTISCPAGPLTFECEGTSGAAIAFEVTAVDDCDPAPLVTCYPPSGTVLPVGSVRTVECRAVDLAGNEAACSFEVRVVDTTPPTISCPQGPIVVDCVTGPGGAGDDGGGAHVRFPAPTAWDACDAEPVVVCDPPSGSFFPYGSTTVVCVARDAQGNASVCTFDVEVVEETSLTLICPGDIVVEATGPDGAVVEFPPAMASDTCAPPPEPSCEPPSGSMFPLGATTVTCRTEDRFGNEVSCAFTVTVRDTRPPAIACPRDLFAECGSAHGTPVSFEVAVEDVCDPDPAVVCDPPSGSLFPTGQTTVVCTASDASGNSSSCSFVVTVLDTRPPEIFCPQGPVKVDCRIGGETPGALAHFPAPVAADACDPSPAVVLSHEPGSFFPLGTTVVTCVATDAAGNQAQCSFEVEVVDETPPMLVCIEDLRVECTGPEGAVVEYPDPKVADDCDVAPIVSIDPPPGSLFPFGTTPVTCRAVDQSGNVVECTFDVTLEDTTPPLIACPSDILAECAGPGGTPVQFSASAHDACDPHPAVEATPPSGSLFPLGTTLVEVVATDASGNRSSCRFAVSVVDTRPPEIACPADIVVECASREGTVVTFTASATDVCGGQTAVACSPASGDASPLGSATVRCPPAVSVFCDPPSGSAFPLGSTTVTCVAADASGNEARCSFLVTVVDTTPPTIVCPAGPIAIECADESSAPAAYPLPAVHDVCDDAPMVLCDPPPGTLLPLGDHLVTCTAADAAGNVAGCTFVLRVTDTLAPDLHCGGDIVLEATGPDGAAFEYPSPTPTDVCDPSPQVSCLPASGSTFPVGKTVVTCTADDESGNMIDCAFSVTVADTTPPAIQCPADIVQRCLSYEGTPVSFTVTASDICDPAPTVVCDPPSGSAFPLGTTVVSCTAVDLSGNIAACSFTVTIEDRTPPSISCPANFQTACVAEGGAVVEYPAPTAIDDCDPAPKVTCDPPSGTRLPLGAHVVRCTAEDREGNLASCEFTVTVVDDAPPDLVCPGDIVVERQSVQGSVVEYAAPVSTDACDGQPPVTCAPPSGSLFALGDTEVVCSAKDSSGNEVRCSFIVRVEDTKPPTIVCPSPIIVERDSPAGAVVEFEVTATDVGVALPVTSEPASGSLFPLGQTTVVSRAVDDVGNVAECSFTVTVVDRTEPLIVCPVDLVVEGSTAGNPPLKHPPLRWPPQEGPPVYAVTAIVDYPMPTAEDPDGDEPPRVTSSPPPGSRLPLGTHTIVATARDGAGNEASCTFQVTVVSGLRAFIRADTNLDGRLDIADPIATVMYLFLGAETPLCLDAVDANDDSRTDITDVVYPLSYIFLGGPPPPEPFFPLCGTDPTPDDLGCERYYPCE